MLKPSLVSLQSLRAHKNPNSCGASFLCVLSFRKKVFGKEELGGQETRSKKGMGIRNLPQLASFGGIKLSPLAHFPSRPHLVEI